MSYLEKKKDRIMVKKGHQFVFVLFETGTYWENFSGYFFFVLISKSFPVPLFDQRLYQLNSVTFFVCQNILIRILFEKCLFFADFNFEICNF